MASVIVTVKVQDRPAMLDLEVPLDMPAKALLPGVILVVGMSGRIQPPRGPHTRIYSENQGRFLDDDETLEEAGIWEGSIIVLKQS
ncbi:MAG TPA: EsaB/YukD family protein [Syntrophomonadaceae bacterium]|nr:EsaB/YukD family protein [Syntrophomonadaceae bacterium]